MTRNLEAPIRRCLLILAALATISCQYDPHAHLLTIIEPRRADIVGTYVLDSVDMPPEAGTSTVNVTVELRQDGTFSATNVPPWDLENPKANFFSTLLSGTGKWELQTMGILDPGAHPIWGIYLRDPAGRMHPAHCTGDRAPYGLIFEIGDPDSGYAVTLKRKPD